MATNGSGGWLFEDADLRFTSDALDFTRYDKYGGASSFVEITVNAGLMPFLPGGGTIRNIRMVHEQGAGSALRGIVINEGLVDIFIDGGPYEAPNGGQGLGSTGERTIARNFTVVGQSTPIQTEVPNQGQIYVLGGYSCGGNVAEKIYFYGAGGPCPPATRTPDPIYSQVYISSPQAFFTVGRNFAVTVSSASFDNGVVAGVQFKYNNQNIGAEDIAAPYSVTLDTSGVPDGIHTLTAIARDASGKTTTANISVRVGTGGTIIPQPTTYAVMVSSSGTGTGSVSGSGSYAPGATVSLSATPATGSTFASWSPFPCAPSFTMPANALTCTATFSLAPATPSSNGTRGTSVTDNNGVLRNGIIFNGGWGSELLWWNGLVYHKGAGTKEWYTWDGTTWISNGLADPQTGVSTTPTVQPTITGTSGLRTVITTGSIPVNSNQLTLPSSAGFNVGDWVIVEIGKEPGQGMRGTRGVGGVWPTASVATASQLPAGGHGGTPWRWAEDTGNIWAWSDIAGAWKETSDFFLGAAHYYTGKAIPRSLQAQIVSISGNTLTLGGGPTNGVAKVGVAGANVYLDTAPILNKMIVDGTSLTLPAGDYPLGGVVWIQNKQGFALAGQGKDQTKLYSPKGVPSAQIEAYLSPNTLIKDLTVQGNWRDNGFGLNWTGSTPAGSNKPVTENDTPQGATETRAIFIHLGSHNSVVQDVRVIDVAQFATGVYFANNIWAHRVETILNDPSRENTQWLFAC